MRSATREEGRSGDKIDGSAIDDEVVVVEVAVVVEPSPHEDDNGANAASSIESFSIVNPAIKIDRYTDRCTHQSTTRTTAHRCEYECVCVV